MTEDGLFSTEPPYSVLAPEFMNSLQEELMNIIIKTGQPVLDQEQDTKDQLWKALTRNSIKIIDDDDYTIQDDEGYDWYIFINLTANRNLNFPTSKDNIYKRFRVLNLDGGYNVVCNPEGTDLINKWNYQFDITEEGGILDVFGLYDNRWLVKPIGDACIYEASTETADSLTVDGTWDDVAGMTLLNGIYGKGLLSAKGQHHLAHAGASALSANFGIGKTSGNNAPDISGANEYEQLATTGSYLTVMRFVRQINNVEYESDGSTIYMKAKCTAGCSAHYMYSATNTPMYIKFIRTY